MAVILVWKNKIESPFHNLGICRDSIKGTLIWSSVKNMPGTNETFPFINGNKQKLSSKDKSN